MSDIEPTPLAETQPSSLSDTQPRKTNPAPAPAPAPRKNPFFFWIGLLIIVGAIALGSFAGYNSGLGARLDAQKTQVTLSLSEQMTLVQQDLDAARYEVARQRLEYILKQDPAFPGAAEKLTTVMVKMSITASPTPTLAPTLTPTPDLRGQETIFTEAQVKIQNKDWTNAMASLDALRKSNAEYKTAQVDGMYFIALRSRGVDEILGMGDYAQQTNLEGGIFDLTVAERFGPLDGTADGLRSFAQMYVTGASFWGLDWGQALEYFRQLYQFTPNLRDASNVTVTERYRIALLMYGDTFYNGPEKNRCNALDYYWSSLNLGNDQEYLKKANDLNFECNPPTEEPTAAPTP